LTPEVLIVGGGPAGCSTALHLARLLPSLRDRILLIDKKRFPREKPCGGGLSGRALATLETMGIRITVPAVATDVVQYRFGERLARYDVAGACRIVRRAEFDTMLLREVAARGVEVAEEEALEALDAGGGAARAGGDHVARDARRPRARTTRQTLAPRVVVGADGAGSLVRRLAGFPAPRFFARLHLLEIPVREDETPEFVDGAFTFDYTLVPSGLQGYVWDFPSRIGGQPFLNTGIFHRNARGPEPSRERLLALLRAHAAGLRARDAGAGTRARSAGASESADDAARLRSYPDAEYDPGAPLAAPGVLLVGSAAGVNALTGEGIWQSLEYGRLAAESIAAAYGTGDFRFADYDTRVARSPMGRDLRLSRRIADAFYGRHFWALYSFQERNEDLRLAYIRSFAGQFDLGRLSKAAVAARWWWHLTRGAHRARRPGPGPWADALAASRPA
jgi:flavin-dependent dehydrogenase